MSSIQDDILQYILDWFADNTITTNTIEWERLEPYAIDEASRLKRAALGLVDQGQKYGFKVSNTDNIWRMAVEWFVQAEPDEDIQTLNNLARAEVYRTMMYDHTLGGLTVDVSPVMDEVFLQRAENWAEGVILFDIRYRTMPKDITVGL